MNIHKRKTVEGLAHMKALETLSLPGYHGPAVYRLLHRVETRLHRIAEEYCNGTCGEETWDRECSRANVGVRRAMGCLPLGIFFNSDCRGYALKLDNDKVKLPEGLSRDWGGYGILAPEF